MFALYQTKVKNRKGNKGKASEVRQFAKNVRPYDGEKLIERSCNSVEPAQSP
jgi:hypothetical protein